MIYPAPKGPPRQKKPRKYLPKNTKPIARSSWLARGTKPIPDSNPGRQARRRKQSASKQRKYLQSETRAIVDQRAGGQCEAFVAEVSGLRLVSLATERPSGLPGDPTVWTRCESTTRLSHHHKTYARYGGQEQPSDMAKVCFPCHRQLELQKPHKANRKGF